MKLQFFETASQLFLHPFTMVNVEAPDQPLTLVNRHFEELTGYPSQEILGKNCRFLQGPNSNKQTVQRIQNCISQRLAIC